MTAEPKVFDPEVEALLREIAADPNSSLLRVTRPQAVKGLFERTERVSPGMTGLSSAERQLVQVHRNEVAHLLREVCRWRMLNDPSSAENFAPYCGTTEVRGTNLHELVASARSLDEEAEEGSDPSSRSALQLIAQCVAGGTRSVHISSIASASHRLEPNDATRIYIGLDLSFRGKPHSALRVYKELLSGSTEPAMRSSAWANAAVAYELLSVHPTMNECSRESALTADNPIAALEWLHGTIRFENKREALRAAAHIAEYVDNDSGTVKWYEDLLRTRRRTGWTPSASQVEFARSLQSSLTSCSRRIADVFA